ncbi:uncharacterized protein [Arachis hypogaea]|uniref:uncharacterized protein n=1 Tax=Arachis hypogaea TaxID=3818 RepID=UPI000DED1B87|nr:uncharacterized protein LOC112735426 [Arachis hypogaea]
MPGIDPEIICHKLALDPKARPIKQKRRQLGKERTEAATKETQKLISASFIREIQFTSWLANVVIVKKSSGKWRMCVDFTDLNRACPKDSYPLPNIDKLVDNTSGYQILSFMDAYSGYNQILMHPDDEDKTAFITDQGNFCYKVMPFGLKNAGATYQRLMDKVFQKQISRNMEVYVDDMVVNSNTEEEHLNDLKEVFDQLKKYNMRLNPEKCAFGVQGGKFLGFMLTNRGIKSNPEKCKAILEMKSPSTIKEVQQLTGRLVALSRFLPTMAAKSDHFFNILRKSKQSEWTEKCENAFAKFKQRLASQPILAKPVPETGRQQNPVYFVSKILQNAETRYPTIEKLAYALIITARRLMHYFQSHKIIVRTNQPLRQVLSILDLAGRLAKWCIELSEYDMEYQPRNSLKSQTLADFVTELTSDGDAHPEWELYIDGAANEDGGGAGIVLRDKDGIFTEQSIKYTFPVSNNQSEYEALLAGMRLAKGCGIQNIKIYCDSLLVVQQVNDVFQVREPSLEQYYTQVKCLAQQFQHFEITHISRNNNNQADVLSKLATSRKLGTSPNLSHMTLEQPSIYNKFFMSILQERDWRISYIEFLKFRKKPKNVENPKLFQRRASFFTIIGDDLYRRGFSRPLLKCLGKEEADLAMEETHEGICGTHIRGWSLATKILRAGYYWPTLRKDCLDKVRKCDNCQRCSPIIHNPAETLHTTEIGWPFHIWRLDILGPSQSPKDRIASFLHDLNIKHHFFSVEHPQYNGLAKAANKVILQALKKKVTLAKGQWAELIPEILWGYNTTLQSSTKETPFRLMFGSDAMIPVEISQGSVRTTYLDEDTNDQTREAELDLLEEVREESRIRHEAMQQLTRRKYNTRVRPRTLQQGDLVLRRLEDVQKSPGEGKLAANWEGPFRVIQVHGRGAYSLQTLEGDNLPNTWNITSLRLYHT